MGCNTLTTRNAIWLERLSVIQEFDQHGLVGVGFEQASRVVGRIAVVVADLLSQLLVDKMVAISNCVSLAVQIKAVHQRQSNDGLVNTKQRNWDTHRHLRIKPMAQCKRSCCTLEHAIHFNLSRVAHVVCTRADRIILSSEPFWQLALHHQVDNISGILCVVEALGERRGFAQKLSLSNPVIHSVPLHGLCLYPAAALLQLLSAVKKKVCD